MISKNTWLLIRFFSFKDSSRFLLKAISVKEYMIVWWTRKWDVLVGRGSLKTTNSVHAAVTVLCMSASRVAPGNGWEGLVSEKPLFPDQRIITQTLGIHGEGDQTEGERSSGLLVLFFILRFHVKMWWYDMHLFASAGAMPKHLSSEPCCNSERLRSRKVNIQENRVPAELRSVTLEGL